MRAELEAKQLTAATAPLVEAIERCWDAVEAARPSADDLIGAIRGTIDRIVKQRPKREPRRQHDAGGPGAGSTRAHREYEIAHAVLTIGKELGRGAFGTVYRAQWRGIEVAVKTWHGLEDEGGGSGSSALVNFMKELDTMARLRHPSVIMLLAAVLDPERMCMVLELGSRGDLHALVHDRKTKLPKGAALRFLASLAAGIQYLHEFTPTCIRERARRSQRRLALSTFRRPSPLAPQIATSRRTTCCSSGSQTRQSTTPRRSSRTSARRSSSRRRRR